MAMTGAGGRGMTVEERDAFLTSGALFAKIGTTNEEGWPMVSPVWYAWDGSAFLVVGKEHTSYIANLRRDPRCGVLVDNASLPYKRVSVLGVAEFLPDTFDWQTPARDMVLRYIGTEGLSYAEATFGFPRVSILIHPRRMTTWDGGGFDRTFHRESVWHEMTDGSGPGRPGPMTSVDPLDLLEELLAIDSANPVMGGPGELRLAERLAGILEGIGCTVTLPPGAGSEARPNLIATLPGTPGLPVVLLESHMDTVAQPRDGLPVARAGGRIVGRGACDTKGSGAAMVAAIARLARSTERPTVVFAGTADEEVGMTGARALVDQLPPVDAAIIGEPTSLVPVRVHNGLLRFRIVARGRSAHTSRAHLGVNAVAAAARAVLAIQDDLVPRLQARAHPLAGPALATAAMIRGGVAPNLVPDWAEIEVDRRVAPGEDPLAALAELDTLLDGLRARGDDLTREAPGIEHPPVETAADHPLVRLTESIATAELGHPVVAGGVPYGTDGSCLSGIGRIPCVVLGPGSIDQAHTEDEWVPADEVVAASRMYEAIVLRAAELVTHGERT